MAREMTERSLAVSPDLYNVLLQQFTCSGAQVRMCTAFLGA